MDGDFVFLVLGVFNDADTAAFDQEEGKVRFSFGDQDSTFLAMDRLRVLRQQVNLFFISNCSG